MAIKKVYELAVDLKRTSVRVNIPVLVQGDSAEFRMRLLDNGAELSTEQLTGITKVSMQSGYDAQTVIQTVGTLQGSVAVFRLKKNELFRAGTVQAMVQLADADDRISTLRFEYQVIPELSSNYIPGEQDITVFQRYINDAQQKIDEMAATDVAQLTVKLAETGEGISKIKRDYNSLKTSFVFVDDDGSTRVISHLKPLFDARNVKFSSAVVSSWTDVKAMSTAQLQSLLADEYEIISHTDTHQKLSDLTESEIIAEMSVSKQFIQDIGGNPKHLIYPYGGENQLVRQVAKRFYESAAITDGGHNKRPLETYRVHRFDVSTKQQPYVLDTFKPIVDKAILNNELCIFTTHAGNMEDADFPLVGELIDYILAQGGEILTYGEAYEKHKNIIEYGSEANDPQFLVGALGETIFNQTKVITAKDTEYTPEDPIQVFPNLAVTVNIVRAFNVQGAPDNKSGTMTTYKLSGNLDYGFQEYRVYDSNRVFRRRWSSGSWTSWTVEQFFTYANIDTYANSSSITEFPKGVITMNEVSFSGSTGFPKNSAGILTTYYSPESASRSYQEYRLFSNNEVFYRHWVSFEGWSEWQPQNGNRVNSKVNVYTNASLPSAFPRESVITSRVNLTESTGFPDNAAGILTTYTLGGAGWERQEFRKYRSNEIWVRYAENATTWTAWAKVTI